MLTTVRHAQLHHTSDFLTKAYTTCAMDTATHFLHGNQRANVLVKNHALFFFIPGCTGAITHSQILQLAFTTLVANRAVQWMVDKQKLHHPFLGLDGFIVLGMNDHALCNRCSTGRHGFRRFFDIHKAHAAISSNREFLVIAKVWNVCSSFFSRMHDRAAFRHAHFLSIELYFNHIFSLRDQACTAADVLT